MALLFIRATHEPEHEKRGQSGAGLRDRELALEMIYSRGNKTGHRKSVGARFLELLTFCRHLLTSE